MTTIDAHAEDYHSITVKTLVEIFVIAVTYLLTIACSATVPPVVICVLALSVLVYSVHCIHIVHCIVVTNVRHCCSSNVLITVAVPLLYVSIVFCFISFGKLINKGMKHFATYGFFSMRAVLNGAHFSCI